MPLVGRRAALLFLLAFIFSFGILYEENDYYSKRRIVQSDPAGQGVSGRVQCGIGAWEVSPPTRAAKCGMERVTFVSLFVPSPKSSGLGITVVAGRPMRVPSTPYAVLRVFLESARKFMPSSQQILLVDPKAEPLGWQIPQGVTIQPIPGNYSRGNLMLQRLHSYTRFLDIQLLVDEPDEVRHFIFADTDIMLVGDLSCVFGTHNFHVGMTYRDNARQPINSGLIFVTGTSEGLRTARRFFQAAIDSYKRKYMRASKMMGDQLALVDVVGAGLAPEPLRQMFKRKDTFTVITGAYTILYLPGARFNWTPPEGAGQYNGMPVDAEVIHFKGSRKRLMLEAWELYRKTNDLHQMKCFILRSGRAKYDF